jgi:peptide/nickel transport system permease protein
MRDYIIRRLLYTAGTMVLVSMIIFTVMRLVPGDAALLMVVGGEDVESDMALYEELRHDMGLDRPLVVQYTDWIWRFVRYGDLGTSFWTKEPVMKQILERMPITLELGIGAFLIGIIFSIPWGVMAAIRQDKAADYLPRIISVILLSAPNFWIGTMLIVFPAIWFGYMAPLGYVSFFDNPRANIQQFIFPWIATGTRLIGTTLRMTRSSMLEVLRQDYIRTAWAKGLRERTVIYRHALKNAMIPVITIVGGQVSFIVGGSVIIENVFGLPGLGNLTVQSINQRDYPQIQGNVLMLSLVSMIADLVVDVSYVWFDPRIKYD